MVREDRAKEIAVAVLEQRRTFPNAIVLATDKTDLTSNGGTVELPPRTRFLVVDGQHRLWAQKFSQFEAQYACVVHVGLSEVDMARLFLEINDNQKRVPSSLRWDLVRLVRPDDDPTAIAAVELVYLLATEDESPFFQRIDLTGEQSELQLKQASLAPDIKALLSKRSVLSPLSFDEQYRVILRYFLAIRDLDRDGWRSASSPFYKARVLRAMLRLMPDLIRNMHKTPSEITHQDFAPYLGRIRTASLDPATIRAAQGTAGIKAIYDQLHSQVFA
jgi:DNA sulfur modification protein DndB